MIERKYNGVPRLQTCVRLAEVAMRLCYLQDLEKI